MAKFVKSSRVNVVSSNVVSDATPVANAGLGSMPANLGSMPANLGSMPANLGATPAGLGSTPAGAPQSATQSVTRRRIKPVAPQSDPQPVESVAPQSVAPQSDPQPVDLEATVTEIVKRILDKEIGEVYNSISRVLSDFANKAEIAKVLEKIDSKMDERIVGQITEQINVKVNDLEARVKDIEDYLSGEGEDSQDECGEGSDLPDSNPTNLTFVDADVDVNEDAADESSEPVNEDADAPTEDDVITLEDIDVTKVLAFMRKEPNTAVNVIRSVRSALGRKQFAISEIQKDEDALAECLEALETMGIDLEQFTND